MRTWSTTRSRLPPEPWSTRSAAPLRDGTYQAESARPSAVGTVTSWCGMPSEASWIFQRGAWVIISPDPSGIETSMTNAAATASQPTPWAARQPSPARRGGRRGAASAARPEATSAIPPSAIPTPVTSRQSGPELTTWRPWETTPKPSASRPTKTASARRVGRIRCGWAASHAAGTATMASTPRIAVSGPEIARSSRCSVRSASPPARSGRSQRAMRSRRPGGRGEISCDAAGIVAVAVIRSAARRARRAARPGGRG